MGDWSFVCPKLLKHKESTVKLVLGSKASPTLSIIALFAAGKMRHSDGKKPSKRQKNLA